MNARDILLKEIEQAPEGLLEQVIDFVKFLKMKRSPGRLDTARASEPSLKKDWLLPEEDKAWQDL